MIDVKALTKLYGDKLAVDHISFSAAEGEILGFLGPNGAGKSTTMNMLTGYLCASSGEVAVDGISMFANPMAAKRHIGYLPEIPPLYMDMTVNEYLRFMFKLKKISGKLKKKEHIEEICAQTGLADVQGRLIGNLSKGFRQRVGIAQAMLGDPGTLILDEPTVGLDPNQILEIRHLIQKLGRNHTVILSSHILQEIQAVCSRIIILHEGRIVADGAQDALVRQATGGLRQQAGSAEQAATSEKPSPSGRKGRLRTRCEIMMEGPREAVQEALRLIPGASAVEFGRRYEENIYAYILWAEQVLPVRRAVFDCAVSHGWRLLGFKCQELSLEDIFARLTTGSYSGIAGAEGKETET